MKKDMFITMCERAVWALGLAAWMFVLGSMIVG